MQKTGIQEVTQELFDQGRFREAGDLLLTALRHAETSELWNDWGAVQVVIGKAAEAKNAFRRALELDPESADAAANMGILLLALGQRGQAREYLVKALGQASGSDKEKLTALLLQCGHEEQQAVSVQPFGGNGAR